MDDISMIATIARALFSVMRLFALFTGDLIWLKIL